MVKVNGKTSKSIMGTYGWLWLLALGAGGYYLGGLAGSTGDRADAPPADADRFGPGPPSPPANERLQRNLRSTKLAASTGILR